MAKKKLALAVIPDRSFKCVDLRILPNEDNKQCKASDE